jgi:hypothetical protein
MITSKQLFILYKFTLHREMLALKKRIDDPNTSDEEFDRLQEVLKKMLAGAVVDNLRLRGEIALKEENEKKTKKEGKKDEGSSSG